MNSSAAIVREWAMPTGDTASIPAVARLLQRLGLGDSIVDPFARDCTIAHWTNDLNPNTAAAFHMEAHEFVEEIRRRGVTASGIIFDPPYSYRQCRELYESVGREWLQHDQQQIGRWSKLKDALTLLCRPGAIVVSFGWNTTGFGEARGFDPVEYLIVNHGSAHNDTMVTVERRRPSLFDGAALS